MSIFDKRSGFDPGPWLKEKTLACLREVAELVDVANDRTQRLGTRGGCAGPLLDSSAGSRP